MKKILVLCSISLFVMGNIAMAKEYRFGLALQTLQNPFYLSLKAGADAAAAKAGNVKLYTVAAQHSTDLDTQVKQLEDFIQMKVDVIGIVPLERRGIIPTIEKINRAGIPVITVDSDAEGGNRECYIATDQVLGGKLAAEWIRNGIHEKGKVAILECPPGALVNALRLEGFNTEIKKSPGINVVASITAKARRDLGMRVMEDIITANPDLNAVFCCNDEMALGAVEALRVRGKLEQVKIVGFNGAAEAIQQVYRGSMAADIVQYPERIGELFIEYALRIAQGEKLPENLPKTKSVPPTVHIDSGVAIVDTPLLRIKVAPALKMIENELQFYAGQKPF
jgi:ribose transport system substrate-binding protein